MSNITTINQVAFLHQLLRSDIQSLSQMNLSSFSDELRNMLLSLIEVKRSILDLFPITKTGSTRTVTTPAKLEMASYNGSSLKNNELHMVKICLKVETDQMIFIKENIKQNGIPKSIKSNLEDILAIYQSTTDRLRRMINTSQVMEIVT